MPEIPPDSQHGRQTVSRRLLQSSAPFRRSAVTLPRQSGSLDSLQAWLATRWSALTVRTQARCWREQASAHDCGAACAGEPSQDTPSKAAIATRRRKVDVRMKGTPATDLVAVLYIAPARRERIFSLSAVLVVTPPPLV